jgi:putative oxygen-independent coproporphyrinogen III oxidase
MSPGPSRASGGPSLGLREESRPSEGPPAAPSHRWLTSTVESGDKAGFGLYLHIPFCAHKCGYCDFATSDRHGHLMDRYVEALLGEVVREAERSGDRALTSVFVGGGTPTLLPPDDLARIIRLVRERFTTTPDVEVTVEANPETVDESYFATLGEAGVNRVSLGAQSFATHVLATLERQHRPDAVPAAVDAARRAGIADLNLDLIYGTPGETDEDWQRSIDTVRDLGVDHVSAYALTVHANTRLGRQVAEGRVPPPDPDLQRDRFETARDILGAAGFDHYEISNWSRTPARRSRHNVLYWRHGDYLGLGVGAHGHVDGHRWWCHRSIERWIDAVEAAERPIAGDERLSTDERAEERLMLGLRLREGLHPHDVPPLDPLVVQQLADDGLLQMTCGRFQTTEDGWYLLDSILARLV